jgi:hypothetical protein
MTCEDFSKSFLNLFPTWQFFLRNFLWIHHNSYLLEKRTSNAGITNMIPRPAYDPVMLTKNTTSSVAKATAMGGRVAINANMICFN